MSEGLQLLAVRINQARQLTQNLRGHGLAPDMADESMLKLKEVARLLGETTGKAKGKITRRRVL